MSKKAVLVVSFGTTYNETRKLTIDAIEQAAAEANPDAKLYRAWTSGFIIRKIEKRDGVHIDNVPQAFSRMLLDGITDVVVQPTHVINGYENDKMMSQIRSFAPHFDSVKVGTPLLTTVEDTLACVDALIREFDYVPADEAVLLMGHGSGHHSNFVYAAMNYIFRDRGHENFFLATVEGYPELETSVLKDLKAMDPKKIHLAPFMVVAGDHANNDLAGEGEDSWKSILEREGFTVEPHLRGLGQREHIRRLYVQHVREAADLTEKN